MVRTLFALSFIKYFLEYVIIPTYNLDLKKHIPIVIGITRCIGAPMSQFKRMKNGDGLDTS